METRKNKSVQVESDTEESSRPLPDIQPSDEEVHWLVYQLLLEVKWPETRHSFERESGRFFNLNYFVDLIRKGEWAEAEKYLQGFTTVNSSMLSKDLFFMIRRQKYMEALSRGEVTEAHSILVEELRTFSDIWPDRYSELWSLMNLPDYRIDVTSERGYLVDLVPQLARAIPDLAIRLEIPGRLNKDFNFVKNYFGYQYSKCQCHSDDLENARLTFFKDHACLDGQGTSNPSNDTSSSAQ